MDYAIYFEVDRETYRLPVNPEEISRSRNMDSETHRMLSGNQVVIPVGVSLEEFSFESEFPHSERFYTNQGFLDADTWQKMLEKWQVEKRVVRFISSNGGRYDISKEVLVTQVQEVEKAGEEGDKYLSINLLEYKAPVKRYVAVQTIKKRAQEIKNPAVASGKTHTVVKGETLCGLARKYYGNGSQYTKIYQANRDKIKNPNLIYPGQLLTIPA